ncbi:MAG: sulfite exporter TauE/SafE family protein [Fibrobacterales bacterium]
MEAYYHYVLIFFIGIVVAFINSIAGGGSMLSLPMMIFLGLPPTVANGTNRVGVFWGNLSSAIKLYRSGKLDLTILKMLLLPVIVGAIVGAWFAVKIPDDIFKPVLAVVILCVTFLSVFSSRKKLYTTEIDSKSKDIKYGPLFLWFFLVGLYGGFIQIGVGFILIFAFSKATNFDLVRVNALKGAIASVFIFVSIIIFILNDKVVWPVAIVFGCGTMLGGLLGATFQVKKGDVWVKRGILVMGILMASKLTYSMVID